MTDQLAFTGDALIASPNHPAKPLTGRQQQAYDYVRKRDGVTADEVGAWLHAHREKRPHSVDERCDFCARDGMSVLKSKAVAPLVKYRMSARAGRLYIARDPGEPVTPSTGLIATSDPNPETNPWADIGTVQTAERATEQ